MKIGLIDIEPKVYNTAYMQIARYHKDQGDTVEWWTPLEHRGFGVVYCSSLFDYTDKSEIPDDVICGGTGFDVTSRLSRVIEDGELDYSIYPKCRKSYLWFSRGCDRDCPFCVVYEKEGEIRPVRPKNLNPKGKYVVVSDNNFFQSPDWFHSIDWLISIGQPVDFQGVDARELNEQKCRWLGALKHHKQIKIAWDNPRVNLEPRLREIIQYIKPYRLMCYVLIGYWSIEKEDLFRVETLRSLGIDPFVMPYDKKDLYQRSFARWVNFKAIFKKVKWEDYRGCVQKQEAAGCGWRRSGNK